MGPMLPKPKKESISHSQKIANVNVSAVGEVTWQRAVSELRKRRQLIGLGYSAHGGPWIPARTLLVNGNGRA